MTLPAREASPGSLRARRYERAVPAGDRVLRGLFYTPDTVADAMASAAVALWHASHPGVAFDGRVVLDPSCGAGSLLAAAARALGGGARLVGTDIDPASIALARERLGPQAALDLGDALSEGPEGDIVLTNPPYGRDPRSEDRDRFVTFWRAALARVRPGGILAVLAPTSWRTGVRYAGARREVIGPSRVRAVLDVPRDAFPDAYVETCVALCAPGSEAAAPSEVPTRPGRPPHEATLGQLFFTRRGILAPPARPRGRPLLVGPVAPFTWPRAREAFAHIAPRDVLEGKAALALDRGPRLLVRRIVGRAARLTCVVPSGVALVKKDFYILVPRAPGLWLPAYAAYLHAAPTARRLAAGETAATKDDFAQVTLTRLRQLALPRLARPSGRDRARVRGVPDEEVVAGDASAWLGSWAAEAAALGRSLCREEARRVDADPRWAPLRARLDAFVRRLDGGDARHDDDGTR